MTYLRYTPDGPKPFTDVEMEALDAEFAAIEAAEPERLRQEMLNKRKARYKAESDPMFLEAQYTGDPADMQAWRDKVAQIKAELPLPA